MERIVGCYADPHPFGHLLVPIMTSKALTCRPEALLTPDLTDPFYHLTKLLDDSLYKIHSPYLQPLKLNSFLNGLLQRSPSIP